AVFLALSLAERQSFDAVLLRNAGQPFTIADDGRVRNVLKLKLTNRHRGSTAFDLELAGSAPAGVSFEHQPMQLDPDESDTFPLTVLAPLEAFEAGQLRLDLEVRAEDGSS